MIMKNALWAVVAGMLLLPSVAKLVGPLEGRIWPVVGPASIIEVYKVEDGWTYFSMTAPKFRDCAWRGTTFYLGRRDAGTFAKFEHLNKPQKREAGAVLIWDKNRTRLSENQLRETAFADVLHQCPGWWRIWLTETRFYN